MTPAYILPQKETRTYRFSVLRVIAMSLMLFLLTAACLYLHNTIQENYVSYLTTAEKKTTAFLAEQLSYMLPFLAIAVFQFAVYAKYDNRDGILQKEQAWEILILAALVYLVLLPYVKNYSDQTLTLQLAAGIEVEKNAGREYEALFLDVFQWFVRLSIPLVFLLTYHFVRAGVEVREATSVSTSSAEAKNTAADGNSEENPATNHAEEAPITEQPSAPEQGETA